MKIRGRTALVAALVSWTTAQAPVATASETGGSQTVYGPGGCSDWGQTAVRNWLTGKCDPPPRATTYTHHYDGGGGVTVRGIKYGDHCTWSKDRPGSRKFNFVPACDMHDYGFYLMQGGKRLKKTQMNVNEINSWFHSVVYYGLCGEYRGGDRTECRDIARKYSTIVSAAAVWWA